MKTFFYTKLNKKHEIIDKINPTSFLSLLIIKGFNYNNLFSPSISELIIFIYYSISIYILILT